MIVTVINKKNKMASYDLPESAQQIQQYFSLTASTQAINIIPTITTSAGAYTSGDNVGGLLALTGATRLPNTTSMLTSVHVRDNANQAAALSILLFSSDPSTGATITDNAAFVYGTTSFTKQIGIINVAALDYTVFNNKASASLTGLNRICTSVGSSILYAVVVTTGTPTYAANATTLYIDFGFKLINL